MAVRNPLELKTLLPPSYRLLGVDLGERRIGLALSDPEIKVATPLPILIRKTLKEDLSYFARLTQTYPIGGWIIGLPLTLKGEQGWAVRPIKAFAKTLVKHRFLFQSEPEIAFWDERWSTAIASQTLKTLKVAPKRQAQILDSIAATYILQGVLDAWPYLK